MRTRVRNRAMIANNRRGFGCCRFDSIHGHIFSILFYFGGWSNVDGIVKNIGGEVLGKFKK